MILDLCQSEHLTTEHALLKNHGKMLGKVFPFFFKMGVMRKIWEFFGKNTKMSHDFSQSMLLYLAESEMEQKSIVL